MIAVFLDVTPMNFVAHTNILQEFNIEGTLINSGTGDLQLNMLGEFHFGSYTSNMKHKSNFSDAATNSLIWQQQRYLNLHLHTCTYVNNLQTKYRWDTPEHSGAGRHHTKRDKGPAM
jgi:hypothetical protein